MRQHRQKRSDVRVVAFTRALVVAIALVASSLALAGCGLGPPSYSDLHRDARSSDEPPADIAAEGVIDSESARLVGEYDGTRVWLSRGASEGIVCLVIAPTSVDVEVACGAAGTEIHASEGSAVSYYVVADGASPPDVGDSTRLSDNVYTVAK